MDQKVHDNDIRMIRRLRILGTRGHDLSCHVFGIVTESYQPRPFPKTLLILLQGPYNVEYKGPAVLRYLPLSFDSSWRLFINHIPNMRAAPFHNPYLMLLQRGHHHRQHIGSQTPTTSRFHGPRHCRAQQLWILPWYVHTPCLHSVNQ